MVCYDGAHVTARSFADMKRSAGLLVSSLLHPTRLLALSSGTPALLAGSRRSIQQASRKSNSTAAVPSVQLPAPAAGDAVDSPSNIGQQAAEGSTQQVPQELHDPALHIASGSQQPASLQVQQEPPPDVAFQGQAQQGRSQSGGQEDVLEGRQQPVRQHQHTPSLESRDGLLRQLSLDAVKEQHTYRSWARAGRLAQLQGMGPVVNAQTIPARGTNPQGASAAHLHISVRRHYKEKGQTYPGLLLPPVPA